MMAYSDIKKNEIPLDDRRALMCSAHGCPMKWSVSPGQLCSYHAFTDSNSWPSITDALLRDGPWELSRKTPIDISKYQGDMKGWARRLRDSQQAGEHLSPYQISCYQSVIGMQELSRAVA